MALKVTARHGGAVGATVDDITARVPAFADFGSGTIPLIQMGMSVQNGGASQGTLIVPDPVGNLDASLYFPPHTQITLTEDASGDEIMLAQGRVSSYSIGRAPVQPPADDVQWNLTIDDANVDLRGLAFTEDWVRPAETGVARMIALAAYTLNGASSTRPDFGGVITYRPSTVIVADAAHLTKDTDTVVMPAKTYPAGTQPQDVIDDCASTEGKRYGVVPHHLGGSHLCLLYIKESDHGSYLSVIKISDDLAEYSPNDLTAPVFAPIWDQGDGQRVDGNANISGLVSRYGVADAVVTSVDSTLGDTNEYWVESYQDGASITAAQAAARASAIIAYRSPFMETDSVTVEVLPEQTHLLAAGMSIQIKAAPINASTVSTIGTFVYRRVTSLQWEPQINGNYHAIMQLNRPAGRGVSAGQTQPASTAGDAAPTRVAGGGTQDQFTWHDPATGYTYENVNGVLSDLGDAGLAAAPGTERVGDNPAFDTQTYVLSAPGVVGATHWRFKTTSILALAAIEFLPGGTPRTAHIEGEVRRMDSWPPSGYEPAGVAVFAFEDLAAPSDPPADEIDLPPTIYPVSHIGGPTATNVALYIYTDRGIDDQHQAVNDNIYHTGGIAWIEFGVPNTAYNPDAFYGQMYGPVQVAVADGSTNAWTLPYPSCYVAGTLEVTVDGVPQTAIEDSPTDALFSLPWFPSAGDIIAATWRVPPA